jgi:subtilisin family serine protease
MAIRMRIAYDLNLVNPANSIINQPFQPSDAGVKGAWETTTDCGAKVAIIDSGIDINHEDLSENIWVNENEIPDNGIDDDSNGYIDDINGWNFSDNNENVYDKFNPLDQSHGTHEAGIIAAIKDNNRGISGVAPDAKVIPLKVFKNGKAYTSDIIDAIEYAESIGAKIVNCSWGSMNYNQALYEVIQKSNMLFVCASGNSGMNIDTSPVYPASFDCANIISVGSLNKYGMLSGFSNYGVNSVDVAAPGEGIQSTLPVNKYGLLSGTSMAAAFVSGEASLLLGMDASISVQDLKTEIIDYSDKFSSLTGSIYGSHKINFSNSVNKIKSEEIIQVPQKASQQNRSNKQGYGEFTLNTVPAAENSFIKIAAGAYHSLALNRACLMV